MIYALRELLHADYFSPAWLRALLAALTSLLVVLAGGSWFIGWLKSRSVLERPAKGDSQRLDLLHAGKGQTPTMGGIVLCGAVLVSTVLWGRLDSRLIFSLCGYLVALACLGFIDDYAKLKYRRKGLSARAKFSAQLVLSLILGVYFYTYPLVVDFPVSAGSAGTCLFLPFSNGHSIQLGAGFIFLVFCVTTGTSNAVNLTDGLDGLAVGCCLLVGSSVAVMALLAGQQESAALLESPYVPEAHEVGVFLAALLGACLGFLWFNCYPARIFMGDTGALPLGGCLGLVAVLLKQEVLLALVGGVLVMEALSVMLQVFCFKMWRKRPFLIAPLHHHFQFKGWTEMRVTVSFWLASAVLALVSLATWI